MTVFMQYIFTNIEKINKNKPERDSMGRSYMIAWEDDSDVEGLKHQQFSPTYFLETC